MKITDLGGFFAGLAGTSEKELTEKLTQTSDDGETFDPKKVQAVLEEVFVSKFKSISEQQHKRGFKEGRESLEKYARSKGAEGQGEELIDALVENAGKEALKGQSGELTEEKLRTHPEVLRLIKENREEVQSKAQKTIEELQGAIKAKEEAQRKSLIHTKAFEVLRANNAILGKNGAEDPKILSALGVLIDQYNYKVEGEPGKERIVPVDDKGNPVMDEKMNNVPFEEHVKSIHLLGFREQNPNNSSPSPTTQSPQGGASVSGTNFKSQSEVNAYINNPKTTPEQAIAAAEAWEKSQKTK